MILKAIGIYIRIYVQLIKGFKLVQFVAGPPYEDIAFQIVKGQGVAYRIIRIKVDLEINCIITYILDTHKGNPIKNTGTHRFKGLNEFLLLNMKYLLIVYQLK